MKLQQAVWLGQQAAWWIREFENGVLDPPMELSEDQISSLLQFLAGVQAEANAVLDALESLQTERSTEQPT